MERAREGVAILFNDVWHIAVIDFRCVSSRILWNKFSRVKVVWLWGTAPVKGLERFWNVLDRIVDRVGNGYILCVLRDLNR